MQNAFTARNLLIAGLFLIPFIAFIVTPSNLFPFITGKAFVFRLLIGFLLITWLYLLFKHEEYRPRLSWITVAVCFFVMVMGVSTGLSHNPSLSFWGNFERMEGYVNLLYLFVFYLVLSSVFKDKLVSNGFWISFIVASLVMAIYGIYQVKVSLDVGSVGMRVDGTFGNPTYLSIFMMFLSFVSIYLWLQKKIPSKLLFFVVLLQLSVIYFTGTRGAVVGLLVGVVVALVLILLGERHNLLVRRFSLVGLFFILVFLVAFFVFKDSQFIQQSTMLSRFANLSFEQISTSQGRFFVWPMALEAFGSHPIFGWGLESFRYVFNDLYDPRMHSQEHWFDRAHSIPLDFLVAGGLLGLISYLGLFVAALYVLWREAPISHVSKSLITALMAAYFAQNLFVFDNLLSYILFFSLLAYIHKYSSNQIIDIHFFWAKSIALPSMMILGSIIVTSSVYFVVYKPFQASQFYVQGLKELHSKGDRVKALQLFQQSIEHNINQHSEIVEQIASNAHLFFLPDVPEQTRANYFYLIDGAYIRKLSSFPDDARDRMNYGRFLYLAGQIERSIDEYKKSIALFPEKQLALFQLGAIYLENGLIDEGVNVYRQAFEAEESFMQARILYGIALMHANNNQKAQEVLEAVPLDTLIANDLFKDVFVKRGDLQSLLRIYKQRYNKNPDDFQTNLTLSMYLVKTGNMAQAIELLESFVIHNPKHTNDLRPIIDELRKGRDPFK